MTDTIFGIITGIAGSVLALSNGIIIWQGQQLRGEFNKFRDDCRFRHEVVIVDADLQKLDNECKARHERVRRDVESDLEIMRTAVASNANDITALKERMVSVELGI